jgi:two-component system response regulator HydG
MSPRILVVDDKLNMRKLLASVLGSLGEVVQADGGKRALEVLAAQPIDVVVTDIRMPDLDGHEVLRAARALERPPEVILMTAFATVDSAIGALRDGAFDYVTKPFEPDDISAIVVRALTKRGLVAQPPEPDLADVEWRGLVARSASMRELFRVAEKVAASEASILILGESGTGKDLLARAIHAASLRAGKPFVALNCAAIPSELMEGELFGWARGSFSGAVAQRAGLFEDAHGGTLFLDEIGEMQRHLQAKLTRVLEAHAVRRIGESAERPVDVRVVAATHRDIPRLVAEEAFREDLFYRLNTCILKVPPLRERPEDVELLANHFLARHTKAGPLRITPEAMAALRGHRWPGNVRELRSAIERAAILAEQGVITTDSLPATITGDAVEAPASGLDLTTLSYRDAIERLRNDGVKRYLQAMLQRFDGNVSAAAEHADVERESFYRLCRRYGIDPGDYRASRP